MLVLKSLVVVHSHTKFLITQICMPDYLFVASSIIRTGYLFFIAQVARSVYPD